MACLSLASWGLHEVVLLRRFAFPHSLMKGPAYPSTRRRERHGSTTPLETLHQKIDLSLSFL
jgi:hypothetical protein